MNTCAMNHQARIFSCSTLLLTVMVLPGCWSMTALNTAKNPPPPVSTDRAQLIDQLEKSTGRGGAFDDTAYYYNADDTRVRCAYTQTPNPVAVRRWFWNIFMPMPLDTNLRVSCDNGAMANLSPGWNKEALRQVARTWYQVAHMPSAADGLPAFAQFAAGYREMTEKPAMTEAVRQYKVGAEAAVRDKQWKEAALQYRKALDINPAWAQGHFNLALLYAELKLFENAGVSMQKYLLLVPDADNARQAQDRIYEWKAQLTRVQQDP